MTPLVTKSYLRFKMPLWPVQADGPESNSDVLRNVCNRDNSRSEHIQNHQIDYQPNHNAYEIFVCIVMRILQEIFLGDASLSRTLQDFYKI